MKFIKKCSVFFLLCLLLFTAGCAQRDPADTKVDAADTPLALTQGPAPQSGLELTDGSECFGVFDKSREVLHLSCKEENNNKVIYVNGQEQLSVPKEKTIKLYDIAQEDAYLELVVAESVKVDQSDCLRVNIYRVLSEGLAEVQLFPQRQNNSFLIDDWSDFSYRPDKGIVQVNSEETYKGGIYQLTPEGYFIYCEEKQTVISVGDEMIRLPERNVAICEHRMLGIAFEPVYSLASTVHYNIYQSLDGGMSWSLIVEDFSKETADIDYISISDDSTIYCFWGISGVTEQRRIIVSEDAGMTWYDFEDGEKLP